MILTLADYRIAAASLQCLAPQFHTAELPDLSVSWRISRCFHCGRMLLLVHISCQAIFAWEAGVHPRPAHVCPSEPLTVTMGEC